MTETLNFGVTISTLPKAIVVRFCCFGCQSAQVTAVYLSIIFPFAVLWGPFAPCLSVTNDQNQLKWNIIPNINNFWLMFLHILYNSKNPLQITHLITFRAGLRFKGPRTEFNLGNHFQIKWFISQKQQHS